MTSRNEVTKADIPGLIDQLRREHFYGRISFDFRDGEIALIRTERTQLVSTPRSSSKHQGVTRDEQQPFGS